MKKTKILHLFIKLWRNLALLNLQGHKKTFMPSRIISRFTWAFPLGKKKITHGGNFDSDQILKSEINSKVVTTVSTVSCCLFLIKDRW